MIYCHCRSGFPVSESPLAVFTFLITQIYVLPPTQITFLHNVKDMKKQNRALTHPLSSLPHLRILSKRKSQTHILFSALNALSPQTVAEEKPSLAISLFKLYHFLL